MIYGINEHDNAVLMVTFARENKGVSLPEFRSKALELPWIKEMSDTVAQCFVALGCVVLAKLNEEKRVDVWNFLFKSTSDNVARKILINSYFDEESTMEQLESVVSGIYHYWHNTPIWKAIRYTYYRTKSKETSYVAGVCSCGSFLDDEGNIHNYDGSDYILDFDALGKGEYRWRRIGEKKEPTQDDYFSVLEMKLHTQCEEAS